MPGHQRRLGTLSTLSHRNHRNPVESLHDLPVSRFHAHPLPNPRRYPSTRGQVLELHRITLFTLLTIANRSPNRSRSSIPAGSLLQVAPLVIYYAKLFVLGSTPRSVYSIKYDLRDVFLGTLFPSITMLMVICTFPVYHTVGSHSHCARPRLHDDLTHYQRDCLHCFLLLVLRMEIPLPLATRSTCFRGHRWAVLPQGNPAHLRRPLYSTSLPCRAILSCAFGEDHWHPHRHPHCLHCPVPYGHQRLLRMMMKVFIPVWLVSCAVLLPIHAAGRTNGLKGLDQFTYGNIAPPERYSAHIILVYFFTGTISFCVRMNCPD